jgi:hypothetical protein
VSLYGFRRWKVREGLLHPIVVERGEPWSFQPVGSACHRYLGQQMASSQTFPSFPTVITGCPDLLPHDRPSPTGRCGYYAARLPLLPCSCPHPDSVQHDAIGVVRLYGRVQTHRRWYRGEHAEIVGLVDYTGTVDPRYPGGRYPDLRCLYSEWCPDATEWFPDYVDWCSYSRRQLYGHGMIFPVPRAVEMAFDALGGSYRGSLDTVTQEMVVRREQAVQQVKTMWTVTSRDAWTWTR